MEVQSLTTSQLNGLTTNFGSLDVTKLTSTQFGGLSTAMLGTLTGAQIKG